MNMKSKHIFVPPTVLSLLLLADPSYGGADYKIYPGSACHPRFGNSAAFDAHVNSLTNTSNSRQIVTCPLERDRIEGGDIDPGAWVASAGGSALTCSFFSMNQQGVPVGVPVTRNTTSSSPTPLIFSGGTITTSPAGTYAITCSLPPGGKIFNYSNGENLNTDSDDGQSH